MHTVGRMPRWKKPKRALQVGIQRFFGEQAVRKVEAAQAAKTLLAEQSGEVMRRTQLGCTPKAMALYGGHGSDVQTLMYDAETAAAHAVLQPKSKKAKVGAAGHGSSVRSTSARGSYRWLQKHIGHTSFPKTVDEGKFLLTNTIMDPATTVNVVAPRRPAPALASKDKKSTTMKKWRGYQQSPPQVGIRLQKHPCEAVEVILHDAVHAGVPSAPGALAPPG